MLTLQRTFSMFCLFLVFLAKDQHCVMSSCWPYFLNSCFHAVLNNPLKEKKLFSHVTLEIFLLKLWMTFHRYLANTCTKYSSIRTPPGREGAFWNRKWKLSLVNLKQWRVLRDFFFCQNKDYHCTKDPKLILLMFVQWWVDERTGDVVLICWLYCCQIN